MILKKKQQIGLGHSSILQNVFEPYVHINTVAHSYLPCDDIWLTITVKMLHVMFTFPIWSILFIYFSYFFSFYLLNVWLWFFQQKFYPLILFYGTLNNFSLFSLFSVYYFRAESSGTTLNKWHGAFELVAKNILHKLFAFRIVVVGRQKRRTKYIFTTTIAETAKRRKKLCFQLIQWSIYCVPLSLSDKY